VQVPTGAILVYVPDLSVETTLLETGRVMAQAQEVVDDLQVTLETLEEKEQFYEGALKFLRGFQFPAHGIEFPQDISQEDFINLAQEQTAGMLAYHCAGNMTLEDVVAACRPHMREAIYRICLTATAEDATARGKLIKRFDITAGAVRRIAPQNWEHPQEAALTKALSHFATALLLAPAS
jgi:hypothetical protein